MRKTDGAFWDSSAILPLYCRQEASFETKRLARTFRRMIVWWGATVELHSAFSRLVRQGAIMDKDFNRAAVALDAQRRSWIEVAPSESLRTVAEELPGRYGVRALDSFQLAAALTWCHEQPRNRIFVCCDTRLSEAATKAGFDVLP